MGFDDILTLNAKDDIRRDVDEAMESRARLFTAAGYVLKRGVWVDAQTGRRMRPKEVRVLYQCGDDVTPRRAGDARWPWPSTYVPF
jgi:hypothetical protein